MNTNRHDAGTRLAGAPVGGRFAPTTKTEASGSGLGAGSDQADLDEIVTSRLRILEEAARAREAAERAEAAAQREFLGARIASILGDGESARRLVLSNDYDGSGRLRFKGLVSESGAPIVLSGEQEELVGEAVDTVELYAGRAELEPEWKNAELFEDPDVVEEFGFDFETIPLPEPSQPA